MERPLGVSRTFPASAARSPAQPRQAGPHSAGLPGAAPCGCSSRGARPPGPGSDAEGASRRMPRSRGSFIRSGSTYLNQNQIICFLFPCVTGGFFTVIFSS